jgi:hypothetical protein
MKTHATESPDDIVGMVAGKFDAGLSGVFNSKPDPVEKQIDALLVKSVNVESFLRLLHGAGPYFEVRALKCKAWAGSDNLVPMAGYFNDPKVAAKEIARIEQLSPAGIYLTLNPVLPAIAAKQFNCIAKAERSGTTPDSDIKSRCWLLIDCDPVRPAGVSSTEAEMREALELADRIAMELGEQGWPDPIRTMSGNGAGLYYRIELPNDDESTDLVKRVLKALHQRYTSEHVHIDQSVFNAARITKVAGTFVRKGSDFRPETEPTENHRPHRRSWFIQPETFCDIVPRELLDELASEAPIEFEQPPTKASSGTWDLDRWLQDHNVPVNPPVAYNGGRKWTFSDLPIPCQSHPGGHGNDGSAFLIQRSDGKLGAGCMHDRCKWWKWKDLRQAYEPGCYDRADASKIVAQVQVASKPSLIQPVNVMQLVADYPTMRDPVIEGILRRGETCNVIAAAKTGKSFMVGGLAWCVATGRPWLSHPVVQGSVLVIDNELHSETFSSRIDNIAHSMMIDNTERENLDAIILRGEGLDINGLGARLGITPGKYSLVVLDALYRFLPVGTSENDNAQMMAIYNRLDGYAKAWDCAIVIVHHASKGAQGEKAVTDVGAGAGSIARAADTHLVIRPHEQDGLSVMEIACRSFKSPEPVSIKYEYPLWHAVATEAKVKQSKGRGDEKQSKNDKDADEAVSAAIQSRWLSVSQLRTKTGMGPDRITRSLKRIGAKSRRTKSKRTGKRSVRFSLVDGAVETSKHGAVEWTG